MIRNFFKSQWLTLTGIAVGALGGFLYWKFVGCTTGSCPITSSPVNSALWGALMGGLLLSSFKVTNKIKKMAKSGKETRKNKNRFQVI